MDPLGSHVASTVGSDPTTSVLLSFIPLHLPQQEKKHRNAKIKVSLSRSQFAEAVGQKKQFSLQISSAQAISKLRIFVRFHHLCPSGSSSLLPLSCLIRHFLVEKGAFFHDLEIDSLNPESPPVSKALMKSVTR